MRRIPGLLLASALAWPAAASAQQVCHPGPGTNEVKLFGRKMVPIAYDAAEAPVPYPVGALRLGLEASYVPSVDAADRTPTFCQNGQGPLNTESQSVLYRPRLLLAGQKGLFVEVSWIPPVSVSGLKSNLIGIAVGRSTTTGKNGLARLRLFTVFGTIKGAFTCSKDDVANPTDAECFNSSVSEDKFKPTIFGGDVSVAHALANHRILPYIGFGVSFLRPRFEVNHSGPGAAEDHTRIETNLTRFTAHGGVTFVAANRLLLTAEGYTATADAITGRVMLSWAFKAGKTAK